MEVLEVAQVGDGGGDVRVQVGRAVAGDLQAAGGRHGGGALPLGDAAAAGDVGLQAVDRLRVDHPREVDQVVPVLARGDIGGHLVANLAQPVEVVRADRFLEPGHVLVRHRPGHPHRLLAAVAAVGVHVELGVGADHPPREHDPSQVPARPRAPGLADLDLDPGDVEVARPALELSARGRLVVGGEPAAAVDRHLGPGRPEQPADREAEQGRLEIPQRRVHRRDRARHQPRPAEVADRPDHRLPGRAGVEHALAGDRGRELAVDQRLARAGRVGVADAGPAAPADVRDHQRGLRPGEGAVGLRPVSRDLVDRRGHLVHDREVAGGRLTIRRLRRHDWLLGWPAGSVCSSG